MAALKDIDGVDIAEGPAPEAAAPEASVDANANLTIEPYKKAILVKGDTKNVKEQLMALKGKWMKTQVAWMFQVIVPIHRP